MASLTHVCMWSDKGWKRITAEEAARLHPGGTVSAHSGLFMCEICGQYVLLTDSTVQVRHFRHSSAEKSKDCPERTFGTGVTYGYVAGDHELPLRIKLNSNGFSFELGFIRVPDTLLSKDLKINISPSTRDAGSFAFIRERINTSGITYLPVGNVPSEHYKLIITGTQDAIYQYWPKTVQGIDPDGSIFDVATGKKLVYDADVEVGKKYYLLKRGSYGLYTRSRHIVVRNVRTVRISWLSWTLYEVTANDYDKESARFFLDYHCRLTEEPVSIQPVWPVHIETPYLIKHGRNSVVLHIKGNAPNTQVFPMTQVRKHKCGNNVVAEIQCNNRQQLISAGRTKALQYTYFWKESLKETTPIPVPTVMDIKGVVQEPGLTHTLPERHILRIQSVYDGNVLVEKDGVIVDKRKLSAGNTVELDDLSWGTVLRIAVGCDIVWSTEFVKKQLSISNDEDAVLNRLMSYQGYSRKVAHDIGGLAGKLVNYPKIRQWIYKCIRDGYMNERAFRELQTWIISANKGDGGIR